MFNVISDNTGNKEAYVRYSIELRNFILINKKEYKIFILSHLKGIVYLLSLFNLTKTYLSFSL